MKKKKHFLSMILGLALSLTILFPSFAQASEIPNQLLSSYEYDDTVSDVRKNLHFIEGNLGDYNNRIEYLPNMETVVSLVRANRGVAFIARDYCAASLENITLIPITDAMPISLNLVYNPKHISEQLKKLQKMMGELS